MPFDQIPIGRFGSAAPSFLEDLDCLEDDLGVLQQIGSDFRAEDCALAWRHALEFQLLPVPESRN